jgi:hypothetical protein
MNNLLYLEVGAASVYDCEDMTAFADRPAFGVMHLGPEYGANSNSNGTGTPSPRRTRVEGPSPALPVLVIL